MTNLNKLRSEFEELPEVKQWIDRLIYGDNSEVYIPKDETEENNALAAWVNGAWFVWRLKAKAQAVPVWVSTDFMKPDDHDYVDILINGKRRIVDAVYLDGKFFIFPPFSKEQWTEVNNKVTHWMPRVDVASKSGAEG